MNKELNGKIESDYDTLLHIGDDVHTKKFTVPTQEEDYDWETCTFSDGRAGIMLPLLASYRLERWLDWNRIGYEIYREEDALAFFGDLDADFIPDDDIDQNLVLRMTGHNMIFLTCSDKTPQELLQITQELWDKAYNKYHN